MGSDDGAKGREGKGAASLGTLLFLVCFVAPMLLVEQYLVRRRGLTLAKLKGEADQRAKARIAAQAAKALPKRHRTEAGRVPGAGNAESVRVKDEAEAKAKSEAEERVKERERLRRDSLDKHIDASGMPVDSGLKTPGAAASTGA